MSTNTLTDDDGTVLPEKAPEFVGAHSDPLAEECQHWTGEEPSPCRRSATHTVVYYAGSDLMAVAACEDCGAPGDVDGWDREWSADREGSDA
ncbi:hypothetical protein [Halorhabdus salina]|uniref:hypothetical protein n=1 Tax=Halorhabdus salina TaxID=2750670 RepID=UPI0015EE3F77|nr:hypothetical protein [Halorhabdus salina]